MISAPCVQRGLSRCNYSKEQTISSHFFSCFTRWYSKARFSALRVGCLAKRAVSLGLQFWKVIALMFVMSKPTSLSKYFFAGAIGSAIFRCPRSDSAATRKTKNASSTIWELSISRSYAYVQDADCGLKLTNAINANKARFRVMNLICFHDDSIDVWDFLRGWNPVQHLLRHSLWFLQISFAWMISFHWLFLLAFRLCFLLVAFKNPSQFSRFGSKDDV